MRLGIIGCGLIGNKRAAAAVDCGAKVASVADLNGAAASALAIRVGAVVLPDWRAVVDSDVDAVLVATTHNSLAEISIAALEAGKHVLVEKPAGHNLRAVQAILDASHRCKRVVKVGFNYRFHPAMAKAKELVDAGALGPMMMVRARHGHGARIGYEKEWRCRRAMSGGGELVDQGSHLIDLARWYLGDLRLKYAAVPTLFWPIEVEDNCFIALGGKDNTHAWLHASWSEWKNLFSFEIYGRTGKIMIDGMGGSYGTERLTFYKMPPQMGPPEATTWEYPGPDMSWVDEYKEFSAAIAEDRPPIGNIADAHAIWLLIDEIYRSGSSKA